MTMRQSTGRNQTLISDATCSSSTDGHLLTWTCVLPLHAGRVVPQARLRAPLAGGGEVEDDLPPDRQEMVVETRESDLAEAIGGWDDSRVLRVDPGRSERLQITPIDVDAARAGRRGRDPDHGVRVAQEHERARGTADRILAVAIAVDAVAADLRGQRVPGGVVVGAVGSGHDGQGQRGVP